MSTSSAEVLPKNATAYDETPYPSAAFPQTHPNRLAAMGRIFGLATADPSNARILELGAADGANILPMAAQFTGSTFLGLDASRVQVTAGQRTIAAAGLKNVELRCQNFMEFPATEGKFDYIIAHGVYSWVPDQVREKIWQICAEHLSDNGIAYISYNALPGWNMRRSLRDMMLYHTRNIRDAKARVGQARALLAFLAESVPTENNAYGILLKNELSVIGTYSDSFLLHDILGEENTPFYFNEFITAAGKHGFQYLSETSIAEMLSTNFPEKVRETLAQLNNQLVAQEQYMDFIRNRSFRQTLLCRAGAPISRNIKPAELRRFAFRSLIREASAPIDLSPGVAADFATISGATIGSVDSFVKAALAALGQTRGVAAIGYGELLERARDQSRAVTGLDGAERAEIEETTLQANLIHLLSKGFIELYAEPVEVRYDVPEKPWLSPVTREEAKTARLLTNRVHQPMPADLPSRHVMAVCDGTRTMEELVEVLAAQVNAGHLSVSEGSVKVTDPAKLETLLRASTEAALKAIAERGFFPR